MRKEQLEALERIAQGPDNIGHEEMQRVYYTEKYVYATDGRVIFRLANDTNIVTPEEGGRPYPCVVLDHFLSDSGIDKRYVEINTDVERILNDMELCIIGNDCYDAEKIRNAMVILGSDVTAWENRQERFRGLHLESKAGKGLILPVRLIGNDDLS